MWEKIFQPWYAHPLHREATRSMSCDGQSSGDGNPTIFADRAMREEHIAFMRWMRDESVPYWDMSGAEVDDLKAQWRKTR